MMKEIKKMAEEIREELEDAEKYAKEAAAHKGVDDQTATMYADLSQQELGHAERIHSRVTEIIKRHRTEHGEPPAPMLAVWEWEHGKMIEHEAKIRTMLDMIRR
jgi:hypothetical protein